MPDRIGSESARIFRPVGKDTVVTKGLHQMGACICCVRQDEGVGVPVGHIMAEPGISQMDHEFSCLDGLEDFGRFLEDCHGFFKINASGKAFPDDSAVGTFIGHAPSVNRGFVRGIRIPMV